MSKDLVVHSNFCTHADVMVCLFVCNGVLWVVYVFQAVIVTVNSYIVNANCVPVVALCGCCLAEKYV